MLLALLAVSECVQKEPWPNLLYTTTPDEPALHKRYSKMAVVEAVVTAGNILALVTACRDTNKDNSS